MNTNMTISKVINMTITTEHFKNMNRIEELRNQLMVYNEAYREGDALISDQEYDTLVEELETLAPDDVFFNEIGQVISDSDPRKQQLPIIMASMNKVKFLVAILKWCKSKGIALTTKVVLTPKFDGMSFCVNENFNWAWTRGDGVFGQRSDEHYSYIRNRAEISNITNENPFQDMITFGEVIMKRSVFADKYADLYENPRNIVAGVVNQKDPSDRLADLDYVRYGIVNNGSKVFNTKSEQLAYLNEHQSNKVEFEVVTVSELTEDYLKDLFAKWNQTYELDGIIIEVDDLQLQNKLGRERNNNPVYARAFKGNFEEVKDTPYLGITWNVSKQGLLKPIIHIEPIRLDGVTVSNVTGNNAKFIQDMQIGKDSILKVKRSGMVIPLIVGVVEQGEIELPTCCPSCKSDMIGWNENNVELVCFNEDCTGQQLQKIIAFFNILDVENVSEGVCTQFYDAGFDTIHKILTMTQKDMESLDRFGKRKAEIVYKAIHTKLINVPVSKLMHATGLFKGLGSKKLALLEQFDSKPSVSDITSLEGFSEISANAFISAYDKFHEFIQGMPITIQKTQKVEPTSNELIGASFCFTGVRDKQAESDIQIKGGKIASGVSKNLTYLVVKDSSVNTSKTQKAQELGCKVITLAELLSMLK
jgi:DNA ligase (NAD+)